MTTVRNDRIINMVDLDSLKDAFRAKTGASLEMMTYAIERQGDAFWYLGQGFDVSKNDLLKLARRRRNEFVLIMDDMGIENTMVKLLDALVGILESSRGWR